MPNLHYSAVATVLAIASIDLINTPADAHQKHIHQKHRHRNGDHYSNKKQKEFSRGYQKGYNKAYKYSAKPPTYYPYSCMENSPKRNHSSKPIPIQKPTR